MDHDGLMNRLRHAIAELNAAVRAAEAANFGVMLEGDNGQWFHCSSAVGKKKQAVRGGMLSVPVRLVEEEGDEYHVGG